MLEIKSHLIQHKILEKVGYFVYVILILLGLGTWYDHCSLDHHGYIKLDTTPSSLHCAAIIPPLIKSQPPHPGTERIETALLQLFHSLINWEISETHPPMRLLLFLSKSVTRGREGSVWAQNAHLWTTFILSSETHDFHFFQPLQLYKTYSNKRFPHYLLGRKWPITQRQVKLMKFSFNFHIFRIY